LRVHELAKELGVASKELLASLKEMGIDGLTASSSVPDQAVPRLRASGGKAVPEAKTVKNRLHLDVRVGQDRIEAECDLRARNAERAVEDACPAAQRVESTGIRRHTVSE